SVDQINSVSQDMRKGAESHTISALNQASVKLPWHDTKDYDLVQKGFIGTIADTAVRAQDGTAVLDIAAASKFTGNAPDTVNPSLWRLARLNSVHGLFKVTEGVYQVRNLDIANMSVIVGERGYIIVDPLYSQEPVEAALKLVYEHLGHRPVTGIIYTHAHLDHFGGSRAAWEARDKNSPDIPVVVPEG